METEKVRINTTPLKTLKVYHTCCDFRLFFFFKREPLGTDGVPSTDSRFPGENRTGRLSMALGTQKKYKKNNYFLILIFTDI